MMWHHVMTSQNRIYLSQLLDLLESWFFFFVSMVFQATEFEKCNVFFICVMTWRHGVMSWRHKTGFTYHQLVDVLEQLITDLVSMVFEVTEFENVIYFSFVWWRDVMASCHDVTSILITYSIYWSCSWGIVTNHRYWFCKLPPACYNVGHDVTMWRHNIVWNWSNTSMPPIFTCQLTRFTYILLNWSILSRQVKWNEISDIVERRHDHDVTA